MQVRSACGHNVRGSSFRRNVRFLPIADIRLPGLASEQRRRFLTPGLRRGWTRYFVVMGSAVVMLPVIELLAPHTIATWLGVAALALASIWLFRHRRKLRTSYFLPLIYAPLLTATHFRLARGIDAPEFTVSIVLAMLFCVIALLTTASWNPYEDDLADLEHLSRSKK